MYEDFKGRVCEGRQIHPEVIDLIAGGRVMTGLTAFGLTAPPDLIAQIKGLESPATPTATARIEEIDSDQETDLIVSPDENILLPGNDDGLPSESTVVGLPTESTVVVLDVDQESSPFAPPTARVTSSLPSIIDPSSEPETAESNAAAALATEDDQTSTKNPTSPDWVPSPTGLYPVTLGPLGRGLVDGIGGLRDSMVFASELFVRATSFFQLSKALFTESPLLFFASGTRSRKGLLVTH